MRWPICTGLCSRPTSGRWRSPARGCRASRSTARRATCSRPPGIPPSGRRSPARRSSTASTSGSATAWGSRSTRGPRSGAPAARRSSPATSSPSSRGPSIRSTEGCASRTWSSSPTTATSCSPNGRTISCRRRMADTQPEPWGEDPKLAALLGEQGAKVFRALLESFPDAVGVLWAIRDEGGRIVDFAFGYGNPSIMRSFRLVASMPDRYTLLDALPQMRGSEAFDAYVRVCDDGEPWVQEITYDTPFGAGYMLGSFIQRTAKLGDGLVVCRTDVTPQRRVEAEVPSLTDVGAHALREPVSGITHLVTLLE